MRRSELAAAGSCRRDIPARLAELPARLIQIICPLRSRRGNSDLMIALAPPPARLRATSSLSPVSSHRHPPTRSLIRNPAPLTEPK
jgi:hypothetical protein